MLHSWSELICNIKQCLPQTCPLDATIASDQYCSEPVLGPNIARIWHHSFWHYCSMAQDSLNLGHLAEQIKSIGD